MTSLQPQVLLNALLMNSGTRADWVLAVVALYNTIHTKISDSGWFTVRFVDLLNWIEDTGLFNMHETSFD